MSGWDGSRPTWEPERHRPDGVPQQAPGAPPGVFDPDYNPFESNYGPQPPAQQPYGQPSPVRGDFAPRGWTDPADPAERDGDPSGQNGYGHGRHSRLAAAKEDYPRQDHGQQHGREDYAQPGYPGRDHNGGEHNGRDHVGRDHVGRNRVDPDYAARMDPALQDFFAPVPPRPDFARPDRPPGQQRSGPPAPARPTRPNRPPHRQPGQPPQPPQSVHSTQEPRPPWAGEQAAPADRWDAVAPRPGSRAARRQDRRPPRRGLAMASAAVGVVVVLGIAAAAYLLLHKPATPAASSTPPAMAPPRATPTASHQASTSGQQTAQSARYTLSTPATAGGYPKLTAPSSSVSRVATATAQAVRGRAVNAGGKVTGQVAAYYQLDSGQVMSFAGYDGTFDPAKVVAGLGSGWQAFPAGTHGGDLACNPSAGTPGGTVCVWVTTTTIGVTEFFGSSGAPEMVAKQAKAAQDTVNVRADVEAAKS
jgi:hypothetical protein